jgi:hypothetical protein
MAAGHQVEARAAQATLDGLKAVGPSSKGTLLPSMAGLDLALVGPQLVDHVRAEPGSSLHKSTDLSHDPADLAGRLVGGLVGGASLGKLATAPANMFLKAQPLGAQGQINAMDAAMNGRTLIDADMLKKTLDSGKAKPIITSTPPTPPPARYADLNPTQRQAVRDSYLEQHPNGDMTTKDLKTLIDNLVPGNTMTKGGAARDVTSRLKETNQRTQDYVTTTGKAPDSTVPAGTIFSDDSTKRGMKKTLAMLPFGGAAIASGVLSNRDNGFAD